MCTVVTRWQEREPVQVLAIRDEFVSRDFDVPDAWWPEQPTVVGGRDRLAGGSWCVTDVASGATALVLNRVEKHTGTPSRGVLPLAAVAAGESWPARVDHSEMASFTLVLARPQGVSAWIWDARALRRVDLQAGTHVFTSRAIDTGDDKAELLHPQFVNRPWLDVATAQPPADDRTALIVRHEFETDVYATVFGQLITATPGDLRIRYSRGDPAGAQAGRHAALRRARTPWDADGWTDDRWPR